MEWLGSNWIWLALAALVFLMFRRGGCGMSHGGHGHQQAPQSRETDASVNAGTLSAEHAGHAGGAGQGGGQPHRHGCC